MFRSVRSARKTSFSYQKVGRCLFKILIFWGLAKNLSSMVMYGYVLKQHVQRCCLRRNSTAITKVKTKTTQPPAAACKSYLEVRIILANNDPPSQYLGGRGWQRSSGHLSCYFDRRQMPHLYGYLLPWLQFLFTGIADPTFRRLSSKMSQSEERSSGGVRVTQKPPLHVTPCWTSFELDLW